MDNEDGNVNIDEFSGKKWILKEKLKFFAETLQNIKTINRT